MGRLFLYDEWDKPFASFHVINILFAEESDAFFLIKQGSKKKKYS